jgi:hypothetical protein
VPKRRYFAGTTPGTEKEKEQVTGQTSQERLFELIKGARYQEAIDLLPSVTDINALDPKSGYNALHMAAGRCSVALLEALWARPDLDETRLDAKNFPASELAWTIGGNEELSVQLMRRERDYALAHAEPLWRGPEYGTP